MNRGICKIPKNFKDDGVIDDQNDLLFVNSFI
jgi:hypothetical protein